MPEQPNVTTHSRYSLELGVGQRATLRLYEYCDRRIKAARELGQGRNARRSLELFGHASEQPNFTLTRVRAVARTHGVYTRLVR